MSSFTASSLHIVFIMITCVHEWPTFQTPWVAENNFCQRASEWKEARAFLSLLYRSLL